MADIVQPRSTLLTEFADNTVGAITPQIARNFIVSTLGVTPYSTQTGTHTLTADDEAVVCDATSGSFNIVLPAAASFPGKVYKVLKIDSSANTVTLSGTISGIVNQVISTQYTCQSFMSNGTVWLFTDINTKMNTGTVTLDFGTAPGNDMIGSTRTNSYGQRGMILEILLQFLM